MTTAQGTAGYSGTPLARKLDIKPGHRVLLERAPVDLALEGLPGDVRPHRRIAGTAPYDVIVTFCADRERLDNRLPALIPRLTTAGGLWVGWPKRSSGLATDLTEDVVRNAGLASGLVDVKVCAIDGVWSGLKLVRRLRDR
jgi:hypothetical protein